MEIKKIYMMVVIGLLMGHTAATQTDNCTVGTANNIRTDPDDSFNPDCPSQANTFDWRQSKYPFSWTGAPHLTEVQSPYWNSSNGLYDELWDEFIGGKDYQPADGWELLKKGVAPDVENFNYVVLYNRFTSIIRVVFALPPTQEDYQFIKVNLKFSNVNIEGKATALLHPRTGLSQPMDQKSIIDVQASLIYTQLHDLFMYADFPVEYDPCTCLQNSKLEVEFQRILNQELELYGRTIDVSRSLASIQGNGGNINTDFLTQTYSSNVFTEGFAGSHTFSDYERLVGHYNTLRQQQAVLTPQYKFFKVFNEVIGIVKPIAGAFLKAIKVDTGIGIPGDTSNNFKPTGAEVLDAVAGIVNLFGAPIKSKIDAVNGRVNTLGATTFSHGEMALRGNITTAIPDGRVISFQTPGQATACNNVLYPAYNEVLGRFALLETPEVNVKQAIYPAGSVIRARIEFDRSKFKYVLNPAAGINTDNTEIWAALQIKIPAFLPPFGYEDNDNLKLIYIIESELGDTAVLQTPLLPVSCLGEFVGTIQRLVGPSTSVLPIDIVLKLFVEYRFEGERTVLQVYTYPVKMNTTISTEPVSPSFLPKATPDYPYELTLPTTNFTQNQTIFAWSNITIEGNLTADPGVKVEILAPNIVVLNESVIGSDIWLHNDFVPFACEPLLPFQGNLQSFCTSNVYQGNISSFQSDDEALALRSSPSETTAAMELPFSMQVYPNPANDYATLYLVLPEDGEAAALLMDPRGQVAEQVFPRRDLPAGEHLFDLDMSDLPPGMYLLSVQTGQGKHTVRVVKQ